MHNIYLGMGAMFSDQTNDSENINQEDENIENNILYVPVAAQAGYTDQFNDIIYKEDLIAFSLPDRKFKQGTYRCFDVAGDSMEPSLQSGDKVVCSLVERNLEYNGVRSNLVYVIVTMDDILVKRVQNNMRINSTFELLSDNTYYPPISLHVSEIKEIWHVDLLISNFMPSQKNNRKIFYDEISEMRKTISLQSSAIQNLNQTLEKLLKSNRSHSVV
jgi:phage repressor protein C with HTH and peptisase S24 domain